MSKLLMKNIFRFASILFIFGYCLFILGCGLFEKSCSEIDAELKAVYNSFVDEISNLSDSEILDLCAKAIEKCPELPIAHELTGMVHWDNKRMKEALSYYIKALTLSPDDDDLLTDAMIVAYDAKEDYLYVTEDGEVKTEPFSKITLQDYVQSPVENRLKWCEFSMSKWQPDKSVSRNIKNTRGQTVGTVSADFKSELKTPQDLDFVLMHQVKTDPTAVLYKATTEQMFKYSSFSYQTELH